MAKVGRPSTNTKQFSLCINEDILEQFRQKILLLQIKNPKLTRSNVVEDLIKNWLDILDTYGDDDPHLDKLNNITNKQNKGYENFKSQATTVINNLIKRDDEELVRIWEIRDRITDYSKQDFDTYLQQMEKDKLIWITENSNPKAVLREHKSKSIYDDLKGLLFYVSWRE